ncbi:MAG: bacteriochlorophyll 4-vinyl reductase, partial [Myxococcales bacterium]|nr:bacteriochlorophyll 4-vinyl reductase [Myxococcales bacterium]
RAIRDRASPELADEVRRLAMIPDRLPEGMLPEPWFVRLLATVRAHVPNPEAVLGRAGRDTAIYVRDNRIPRTLRSALGLLPARAALPLLLEGCRRHAWTFAGAGTFRVEGDYPYVLSLRGAPTCRPESSPPRAGGGAYYAAAFQELLALVSPGASVTEVACVAYGAPVCRFEITLPELRARGDRCVSS